MGSDLLAVFSLTAAMSTSELLASALVSLMLSSGRMLESWAQGQAERQLTALISRMPKKVRRLQGDGTFEEISLDEILVGDQLLVRNGEVVPADGRLLESATLDESALTGEPLPVMRNVGEDVSSGVLNAGSPFTFTATANAASSTYSAIISLVEEAQKKSAPTVRIANSFAVKFIPIALSMAIAAYVITGETSHAVAVLVAATPCPLILAVPIAVVSGLSRAAKRGAIIKGGAVLESLGRTEVVLLDKTGTLTHGGPVINEISSAPGVSDDEVLQLAGSVDFYSPHIVALAIIEECKRRNLQLLPATDVHEVAGHHIEGRVNGHLISVGQLDSAKPSWLHFTYPLMVGIARDGLLIGVLGIKDPIRPESAAMVSELFATGVTTVALVTGDRNETAQEVAAAVGISTIYSEVSAAGKLEITKDYIAKSQGIVVVVGDGINDAPALALADVGVAMGARGASAASEAADVIIVEDSIDRLTSAISIAKLSRKKAEQAAFIGMGLSLIAMVCGATGIFSPSVGAVTQEFIDVVAILWALTILIHKEV